MSENLRMEHVSLKSLGLLPKDSFYVVSQGKIVQDWTKLTENDSFQVCPRVLGGKGGFGSLLRSFRIYRSTNQDMCRDLSGRRMKDVKEEEKLKKWIAKKAEREAEKEKKKQEKYLRLKQGDPKHTFQDPQFSKTQDEILEKTEDAIEQGLKAALGLSSEKPTQTNGDGDEPGPSGSGSNSRKRPAVEPETPNEPPKQKIFKQAKPDIIQPTETRETPGNNDDFQKPETETQTEEKQPEKAEKKQKKDKKSGEQPVFTDTFDRIDLETVESMDKLVDLGPEPLKFELYQRGLKCGGTVEQRAERLWSVRGLKKEDIPKNLKAKK